MNKIPDDYVRMQKCIQCGKDTGAILFSKRLQSITVEETYSDFCKDCKKLFKTHAFFHCETCGKTGFIKRTVLKNILIKERYKEVKKFMRFKKCPTCMGIV